MSLSERKRLAESWENNIRKIAYESNLAEFNTQKLRYEQACRAHEDAQDEARRILLGGTDLIACTTTGAAKSISPLTSIEPEVVMVEEAGQVLEAHILASFICIGDPKRLRPTPLSTFALSMDSASGQQLFKLDRSLMERLSDVRMAMSQINMQRRMRPTISHFVRKILYPKLKDHEIVHNYPYVQGVEKNAFIFSHNNAENAEADSVSKYNMFEKVRAALRDLQVAVSVDERDEEKLERTGLGCDDELGFAQVQVARHVNSYRNSGAFEEGEGSIGFLKSPNRINVALSRAKHGLYILGNASNLRKDETWRTVLDEMENEDQIGYNTIPVLTTITSRIETLSPVCGEPCEEQTCTSCLPDERKFDIVDFVMQRQLAETDLDSEDISERLMKLACGHIFTVETLDGHCNMSEYYEIDTLGVFLTTKAPQVNYQTPPSCPTCRGPITAFRYGRITKRANLDILEQNVASKMSSDLDTISAEIESFSASLESANDDAKMISFSPPGKGPEAVIRLLRLGGMTAIHGFSGEESRAWNKIVRVLLKLYCKAAQVARTRGPHIQAYGAALVTLYRLELDAIASDPERACDKQPLALAEVNKKMGQPPHKADTRFQVEGFFLSLELRYTLAEIAQSRIEVSFVYESCIRDAEKALAIAQKSAASRLAARAAIYALRGELELFRFDILTERTSLAQEGLLDTSCRKRLSYKVQQEARATASQMKSLEITYVRSRPATGMNELKEERAWFGQHCREKGDKYVAEYEKLANHLLTESTYAPLSLQEKADIVKAFGFCK
ncbi:hypothetical protein F5148DRAFT_1289159 [Russula earlei]|uniref:Uncharacterized protein n=1 Tax=Russula earlei TaxID=71964 RepID=A0ACC0TYQ1_9AGAM|nr:hypothetical protein F5148DRAFT_1289159 [Russula earlei]